MKELITKLKEIETIVELNVGKELTEETATDIYGLTNELMGKVKKLPIYNVSNRRELLTTFRTWWWGNREKATDITNNDLDRYFGG
jgi:hypothetical protein